MVAGESGEVSREVCLRTQQKDLAEGEDFMLLSRLFYNFSPRTLDPINPRDFHFLDNLHERPCVKVNCMRTNKQPTVGIELPSVLITPLHSFSNDFGFFSSSEHSFERFNFREISIEPSINYFSAFCSLLFLTFRSFY